MQLEPEVLWSNVVVLAGVLGVVHTAVGPDHYLPFVAIGRARRWSVRKTLAVTLACGLAHVGGSLLLGAAGLLLGVAVARLELIDSGRGDLAAWAMVAFGITYAVWGLRWAWRDRAAPSLAPASAASSGGRVLRERVFWALLLVFVLGPCEPLIPLFMLPASQGRVELAVVAAVVFAAATLLTMAALTAAGRIGLERAALRAVERWLQPASGAVIAGAGAAMVLGA